MSKKPVYTLVDELPKNNLTIISLKALDFAVPGAWHNLTGFVNTIKEVTGETDEALIKEIGDRAITLYNDSQHQQLPVVTTADLAAADFATAAASTAAGVNHSGGSLAVAVAAIGAAEAGQAGRLAAIGPSEVMQ